MTDRETTYWLMGLWADKMWTLPLGAFHIKYWQASCGAIRCAAGHAACIPELQARGLTLDEEGRPVFLGGGFFLSGFLAISEGFGIRKDETAYICASAAYPNNTAITSDVIWRIEHVRARYAPPVIETPTTAPPQAVKVTIKLEPIETGEPTPIRELQEMI